MKDVHEAVLRGGRPAFSAEETIGYCLKQLFADNAHRITDELVHGLTYEEIIGTLLQAEDLVRAAELAEFDPDFDPEEDDEDFAPTAPPEPPAAGGHLYQRLIVSFPTGERFMFPEIYPAVH